jgi:hypothetical protein
MRQSDWPRFYFQETDMKKILATLASALALALAGAAPAFAQAAAVDPAAGAAANELFVAMNYRPLMAEVMQQMSQGLNEAMRASAAERLKVIEADSKLTPEQKQATLAKANQDLNDTITLMQSALNDPGMIDEVMAEVVPLYARTFSANELKQLAAFYRTPVGAKVLATLPALSAQSMQIGQQVAARRLAPFLAKVQQQAKPQ